MAKYVIHKKAFFYTDECYDAEDGVKGSVMGTYQDIEEAKTNKKVCDIKSMKKLGGQNAVDFFFEAPNYDEIYNKLEAFYKSDFDISIDDKYYFSLPNSISDGQAERFLEILNISFHDIVEYADSEEPKKDNLRSMDLGEF